MAFFSIIVPVYRTEKYLDQCVKSILNQSFNDYELILVNDGSPDRCPEICNEYATRDQRIKVLHKENGGLSDARNCGLDCAEGEYVFFLDSDDYWDDSHALRKVYDKIQIDSCDVLVFVMKKLIQITGEYVNSIIDTSTLSLLEKGKGNQLDLLMKSNLFVASACDKVVRRELIEKYDMRFVVGQTSEDIEWCTKLLLIEPRISFLNESFYIYRIQKSNTLSTIISVKNILDMYEVLEKYVSIAEQSVSSKKILHYLALQYVLLMTNMERLKSKDIKMISQKLKKYWYLLQYDFYPYVKKVKTMKWVGYRGVRRLLKCYWFLKRG